MPEVREMTCIVCPIGCRLKATANGSDITVEGNTCARGRQYGLDEICSPMRMLTSTVRIAGGFLPRLPVRSSSPIPKGSIKSALQELASLRVEAPVGIGQVILANVAGTGVDIISSRPMERV